VHDVKELTRTVVDFVTLQGACAVGIASKEMLAGGPPSTDLEYVLPGAESAISFAVPFDQDKIERYLAKQDHAGHQDDNFRTNFFVTGLAHGLALYLDQRGHPSYGAAANGVYRKDTPLGIYDFMPDISHRYLAVRSGVGWFGLSGNVITKTHGASVVLGSVVTTAELEPTEPLPPDEKYCDECKLCFASCTSGLMDRKQQTTVTIGGEEYSHSKRRSFHRCDLVCGGFTGLAKNGKWSTWSPGRFPIPDADEEFLPALVDAITASEPRPSIEGGFHHPAMPAGRKINMTCGNCQLVCHPDPDERKRRFKLLTKNGVVIQNPDGSLEAVAPEIAEKYVDELKPEQQSWYRKT
jgi:epoxyqueuosine reductase QueG